MDRVELDLSEVVVEVLQHIHPLLVVMRLLPVRLLPSQTVRPAGFGFQLSG